MMCLYGLVSIFGMNDYRHLLLHRWWGSCDCNIVRIAHCEVSQVGYLLVEVEVMFAPNPQISRDVREMDDILTRL